MSKYVSVVDKVRSKLLRSIAFFLYVVTVRTEVKCAAVVLHKKRKEKNMNDALSHYGAQISLRSQSVRSGACKLDDDTKIAEEHEVNGNEHPAALATATNAFYHQSGQLSVFSRSHHTKRCNHISEKTPQVSKIAFLAHRKYVLSHFARCVSIELRHLKKNAA